MNNELLLKIGADLTAFTAGLNKAELSYENLASKLSKTRVAVGAGSAATFAKEMQAIEKLAGETATKIQNEMKAAGVNEGDVERFEKMYKKKVAIAVQTATEIADKEKAIRKKLRAELKAMGVNVGNTKDIKKLNALKELADKEKKLKQSISDSAIQNAKREGDAYWTALHKALVKKKKLQESIAVAQGKFTRDLVDTQTKAEQFISQMKINSLRQQLQLEKEALARKETREKFIARMKVNSLKQQQTLEDEALAKKERREKFIAQMKVNSLKQEQGIKKRIAAEELSNARKVAAARKKIIDGLAGAGGGKNIFQSIGLVAKYGAISQALYGMQTAIRMAITTTLDFDNALYANQAVLNKTSTDSKRLIVTVKQLGIAYGGSFKDIQEGMITLGRAGVDSTSQLKEATTVLRELSLITGDSMKEGAIIMSSLLNVFGTDVSDNIKKVGDQMAYVANATKLGIEDFSTIANYALSSADSLGITKDSFLALSGAMSKVGVNASTIGTNIRRLQKLVQDGSKANVEFFRVLGSSQQEFADALRGNSDVALSNFIAKLGSMSDAKYTKAIKDLPVLLKQSVNVMRTAGKNEFFSDMLAGIHEINKDLPSLSSQAAKMAQGMGIAVEKVKNSLSAMLSGVMTKEFNELFDRTSPDEFNEALEKVVKTAKGYAEAMVDAVKWVASFKDEIILLGKAILGGMAIKFTVTVIASLAQAMAMARTVAIGLRVAMIALAVSGGWIVALVAGVAALATYIFSNKEAAESVDVLTKAQKRQAEAEQANAKLKQAEKAYGVSKNKVVGLSIALQAMKAQGAAIDAIKAKELELGKARQKLDAFNQAADKNRAKRIGTARTKAAREIIIAGNQLNMYYILQQEGVKGLSKDITALERKTRSLNRVLTDSKGVFEIGGVEGDTDQSEKSLKALLESEVIAEQLLGTYSKTKHLKEELVSLESQANAYSKSSKVSADYDEARSLARLKADKKKLQLKKAIEAVNVRIEKSQEKLRIEQVKIEALDRLKLARAKNYSKETMAIAEAQVKKAAAIENEVTQEAKLLALSDQYVAAQKKGIETKEQYATLQEQAVVAAKAHTKAVEETLNVSDKVKEALTQIRLNIVSAIMAANQLTQAFVNVGAAIETAGRKLIMLRGGMTMDQFTVGTAGAMHTGAKNNYTQQYDTLIKLNNEYAKATDKKAHQAKIDAQSVVVGQAHNAILTTQAGLIEASKTATAHKYENEKKSAELEAKRVRQAQGVLGKRDKIGADGKEKVRSAKAAYEYAVKMDKLHKEKGQAGTNNVEEKRLAVIDAELDAAQKLSDFDIAAAKRNKKKKGKSGAAEKRAALKLVSDEVGLLKEKAQLAIAEMENKYAMAGLVMSEYNMNIMMTDMAKIESELAWNAYHAAVAKAGVHAKEATVQKKLIALKIKATKANTNYWKKEHKNIEKFQKAMQGIGDSFADGLMSGDIKGAFAGLIKDIYSVFTKPMRDSFSELFGDNMTDLVGNFYDSLTGFIQTWATEGLSAAMAVAQGNAVAGVAGQAQGEPYSAWARMAAMAATMAGMGLVVGAISGGNNPDFKYEDVDNKNWETGADISGIMEHMDWAATRTMKYSGAMLDNLQALVRASGQAARGLISSGYTFQSVPDAESSGFLGFSSKSIKTHEQGLRFGGVNAAQLEAMKAYLFSSGEKTKTKWWGLSSKTSQWYKETEAPNDVTKGIIRAYQSGIKAVLGANDLLKMGDNNQLLKGFQASSHKINFEGMSQADIASAIQGAIGSDLDTWVRGYAGWVDELAQGAETALETYMRVAYEFEAVQQVFADLGSTLSVFKKDGVMVSDAFIKASGGLSGALSNVEGYIDNFYDEEEKQKLRAEQIMRGSKILPKDAESYRKKIEDLTADAGGGDIKAAKLLAEMLRQQQLYYDYYETIKAQNEEIKASNEEAIAIQQANLDRELAWQEQRLAFYKDIENKIKSAYTGTLSYLNFVEKADFMGRMAQSQFEAGDTQGYFDSLGKQLEYEKKMALTKEEYALKFDSYISELQSAEPEKTTDDIVESIESLIVQNIRIEDAIANSSYQTPIH